VPIALRIQNKRLSPSKTPILNLFWTTVIGTHSPRGETVYCHWLSRSYTPTSGAQPLDRSTLGDKGGSIA
jgi:hypothetical protein